MWRQRSAWVCLSLVLVAVLGESSARAQEAGAAGTVEVGRTGFDVRRPVLASACENGCPWGELGDFVTDAMKPLGYDVVQCRNCNQDKGPPLVSADSYPPPLSIADTFVGTTTRVDARVDFGITESSILSWAYGGLYNYATNGPFSTGSAGPFKNLRLVAKIDDPTYLLIAVKASSGITDLSQIAQQHLAVTVLGGTSPISRPVLEYYGLTQAAVTSWGGSFQNAIVAGTENPPSFDVIVDELGSPSNNPESAVWEKISQDYGLTFLEPPLSVIAQLAKDPTLGVTQVTVRWGLLRGVDRPIATVGRSGHAVFVRDDAPEQAAYDIARAIDQHREALKWYIRPYSYDSRSVWQNGSVPLHPGAQRYYREVGYLTGAGAGSCPSGSTGGCGVGGKGDGWNWLLVLLVLTGAVPRIVGQSRAAAATHSAGSVWQRSTSFLERTGTCPGSPQAAPRNSRR